MKYVLLLISTLLFLALPVISEPEKQIVDEFNADQAARFLRSVAAREVATERADVLRELITEKTALRFQILQGLSTSYGWQPGFSYRFDAEDRVLVQITRAEPDPTSESESRPSPQEQVIHAFQEQDDLNRFNRYLEAKRSLDSQIQTLSSVLTEQLEVLARVRDQLQRDFQIDSDRDYHYDHQAKTLYLLKESEEK